MSEPVITIFPEMTEVMAFNYANAMPISLGGAITIASAELEAHEWVNEKAGEDITEDFLSSAAGNVATTEQVRFQFQDPPVGKMIRVKTKTTFSDGQVRVSRMFFEVKPA
jgi:hypothetical protein